MKQAFTNVINDCVIGLQDRFKDGLEEKCQVGAANVLHLSPALAQSLTRIFRPLHQQWKCLIELQVQCTGRHTERVRPISKFSFVNCG
jgi:hypothetical protein